MSKGKQPCIEFFHFFLIELFLKAVHAKMLNDFLEQVLQENTVGSCCCILSQSHHFKYLPVYAKGVKQMSK